MNTIFKYLCVPALIILPASSIYAEGEDVKLQNEKSLTGPDNDYHGKNLFITWTKDDNGGDAPVKGAQIIAQNITIETNFPDKYPNGIRRGMYRGILNKGIYNTDNYQSDITAPGTIVSFHSKCKVWEQRPDTVWQFKEPCQCGVPRIFQGAA